MVLAIFLVVEYLILPQIAGVRKSLSLLSQVDLPFVLAGVLLEAAALCAYAQLTRAVIPRGQGPSFFTLLRIGLTTLSVSHILPGGAAAGSGLGYRLLTEAGVSGPDAGFALGTQAIGSAVVLNVLLWLGLVISIPLRGFNPIYLTAAVVGVIVIGAFSGLVLLLTRGEARAAQVFRAIARRLPFLDPDTVDGVVHRLAQRVHALLSDRALVRRAILWATVNWLLDAASLWVFLAAFGYRVGIDGLIVSYGLANVLAAIPITPGGLGVVEAVLTSSLVGFGSPRGVAILGVIGYRLVNFWLPIPLGGLASVSLRVAPGAPPKTKEELRRLAEEGCKEAEDARTWAARHGFRVGETSDDAA
ncbi:MAG: putative heme transporter [Actinomycetota bacterium]|jgi:uncharacterized protein (TIRG00374 family)|nr:putative heme transporter [Actinomycetota bacterium]